MSEVRVPLNAPWITQVEIDAVVDALRSGWTTTGRYVSQIEREFARVCGRQYGVACSSGTAALWLALRALGIGAGDRVLAQSYTCDAVANAAISVTGQPPRVVDVDERTWAMRADFAAQAVALHPDIKAVTVAHCYGVPALDLEVLEALCHARGLPLIEDASEAHGASLRGRPIGNFGVVSIFSFRGEKTLGAGQFGLLVTDDKLIAQRARQWSHNGLPADTVRYWSTVPGLNFQPSNLHAALACAQLGRIGELMAARRTVHERWRRLLADIPGLTFQAPHGEPSWWLTGIVLDPAFTAMLPQDIGTALAERGIQSRPGFYPLNALPHCRGSAVGPTPVAERLLRQLLILPSGPTLTAAQQEMTVEALLDVIGWRGGLAQAA